jgi:DNA-directed RNA polymerase delta subunit
LDLEVKKFKNEMVYEDVVMKIEDINGKNEEMMCKLIKYLYDEIIIKKEMMERGFIRV